MGAEQAEGGDYGGPGRRPRRAWLETTAGLAGDSDVGLRESSAGNGQIPWLHGDYIPIQKYPLEEKLGLASCLTIADYNLC